jgi:3-hydroxyisobutyrate dehydrogenase
VTYPHAVGVIGAGAMGIGVVASLVRAGLPTRVRDIRRAAEVQAQALGATCDPSPASLVRACDVSIILVVDAQQVETVLFGPEGAAAALPAGHIVMLASTVDPDSRRARAARRGARRRAIDAPVSAARAGGEQHDDHDGRGRRCRRAAADPCSTRSRAGVPRGSAPSDAARFRSSTTCSPP